MLTRVLIIGSKDCKDYTFFEEKLYQILEENFEKEEKIIIREQEVTTLDNFAVRFSKENNCELERYPIQWDKFGKRAAYENIKHLVYGHNVDSCIDTLVCFYKKGEDYTSRLIPNKIIDEFKSIINLDINSLQRKCHIFVEK